MLTNLDPVPCTAIDTVLGGKNMAVADERSSTALLEPDHPWILVRRSDGATADPKMGPFANIFLAALTLFK